MSNAVVMAMELKWKFPQMRRIRKAEVESIVALGTTEMDGGSRVWAKSEARSKSSTVVGVGIGMWRIA